MSLALLLLPLLLRCPVDEYSSSVVGVAVRLIMFILIVVLDTSTAKDIQAHIFGLKGRKEPPSQKI